MIVEIVEIVEIAISRKEALSVFVGSLEIVEIVGLLRVPAGNAPGEASFLR